MWSVCIVAQRFEFECKLKKKAHEIKSLSNYKLALHKQICQLTFYLIDFVIISILIQIGTEQ